DWHLAEARHDAIAAQAQGEWSARTAYALGNCPQQIGSGRKLARGRRTKLELLGREIARLRCAPGRQRGADRAVALAPYALALDAGHGEDVAPPLHHLRMLPGHVRALVAGERVLVGDDGPAILRGKLALPGRHRRALRLEGLHGPALAHPPEPVVVPHFGD